MSLFSGWAVVGHDDVQITVYGIVYDGPADQIAILCEIKIAQDFVKQVTLELHAAQAHCRVDDERNAGAVASNLGDGAVVFHRVFFQSFPRNPVIIGV